MVTLVGIFENHGGAEAAVHRLEQLGYARTAMSIVTEEVAEEYRFEVDSFAGDDEEPIGWPVGAALGGLIGFLVSIASLAIPAIAPHSGPVPLGVVVGILAGAVAGGLAAPVLDMLMGAVGSMENAERRSVSITQGGSSVSVDSDDSDAARVRTAFRDSGAVGVHEPGYPETGRHSALSEAGGRAISNGLAESMDTTR